ncbi:MAG TPA: hypothetical protein PLN21_12570 [Gemmatales bacterium]|nr:hypothetical protein [Gemmatales bacterium]
MLARSLELQTQGFTQDDLDFLAGGIMNVYGGMGSFSDYQPIDGGKAASWIEEFEIAAGAVYAGAFDLRITGSTTDRPCPWYRRWFKR